MSAKSAGKVAVVTGAPKGIGAAIARHLAAAEARVVVNCSPSREGAEQVVKAIKQAGGKAIAVGANVAEQDEITHLLAETKAKFGRVDILVNNAGISEMQPLAQIDAEHFHKQFDLNVLGLNLTTQVAIEHFGLEGGSVINISSVAATHPMPNGAVYSATRAAVDAVTKSLAKELGSRQIRVNSLNPGFVETEGTHAAGFVSSEFATKMAQDTPLGRVGQPDDIATVAVFLASDDSGWISGQILPVAGGWPIR